CPFPVRRPPGATAGRFRCGPPADSRTPRSGTPQGGPPMTDTVTARLITDDSDALRTAHALVPRLAAEADQRDAERRLPWPELAEIRASGLLGITVPASRGGAEVAAATVAEVMRLVGTVDLSVAQILQPHFAFLYSLRRNGSPTLQEKVFTDVLNGALVGNAQAERTGKHSHDQRTTLERTGADRYRITGVKYYATGSLFAQWLAVTALLPVSGHADPQPHAVLDRKSTRLNSSHVKISYAVFCLKK